jgi:hypothetical protein
MDSHPPGLPFSIPIIKESVVRWIESCCYNCGEVCKGCESSDGGKKARGVENTLFVSS